MYIMKYHYEMGDRMWEINRCRFIFVLALAGTMWLLGWGEQAWSASAVSQFFLGQRNAGSGNNAEYMINLVDTPSTPCQSTGDKRRCAHMGDIFIGMIDLGVLEDQTGGGGHHNLGSGTANDELTGLIALKITTQTLVPKLGGGSEADQSLGPVNRYRHFWTYGGSGEGSDVSWACCHYWRMESWDNHCLIRRSR